MLCFGYKKESESESLDELEEVSFACSPASIREIAAFLDWAATEMEKNGPAFGHEHLADFDSAWNGGFDVIVAGPTKTSE